MSDKIIGTTGTSFPTGTILKLKVQIKKLRSERVRELIGFIN